MSDQKKWNERYQSGEFGFREPDPFVIDTHRDYLQPLLPAGSTGLDLAGGAGHHAVWLAQQGWRMTLADFSETALALAKERSAGTELAICCGAAEDLARAWSAEQKQFGFILVSFFLERAVLPLLPALLAPGGLLLYRSYTVENIRVGNPRGSHNPDRLLQSQELLKTYSNLRILHYHETVYKKGVVELVAQRV
jgi:2-polyprenyl-3-methyl-5-hydroxy-6-metoxy-1,4-benzoquinol methylase